MPAECTHFLVTDSMQLTAARHYFIFLSGLVIDTSAPQPPASKEATCPVDFTKNFVDVHHNRTVPRSLPQQLGQHMLRQHPIDAIPESPFDEMAKVMEP